MTVYFVYAAGDDAGGDPPFFIGVFPNALDHENFTQDLPCGCAGREIVVVPTELGEVCEDLPYIR
jgi:hypothetical protein